MPKQKILVVEDSEEFQLVIRQALAPTGYELVAVATGLDADKALRSGRINLILLDVMLPDQDGFSLCRRWQQDAATKDVPVIFVTGKADLENKLLGFSLGAEDYIVKPFEPLELRARIEAKLKKSARASAEVLIKGEIKLSVPFQRAFLVDSKAGTEKDIRLTPAEFKILYHLMKNEGRVVPREELLTTVWGDNVHVVDQSIYTHMSALRRKLQDKANCIESFPGSGYRFLSSASSSADFTV